MSTSLFLPFICVSASLLSTSVYAQLISGMPVTVFGEIRSFNDAGSGNFLIEVYDVRSNAMIESATVNNGQFELDHVPEGTYAVRLVTARGAAPIVEEFHQFGRNSEPLVLDVPPQSGNKPISGIVSLRELQHPIPKKALRAAYESQQFVVAKNVPKAIAKLEEAVRIDPTYRDAHCNLGILYARAGRAPEARVELQKALDIGPPAAPIYADLALVSAALRQLQEAELFAHKALELDPANNIAQRVLGALGAH